MRANVSEFEQFGAIESNFEQLLSVEVPQEAVWRGNGFGWRSNVSNFEQLSEMASKTE
jgi:hypothetical protein